MGDQNSKTLEVPSKTLFPYKNEKKKKKKLNLYWILSQIALA